MKDSLEYLNDIKIDLNEYEEYSLTDLEKQKMKNNIKKTIGVRKTGKGKKVVVKVSGMIAILAICVLIFGITFPTYAEDIPGLKQVIQFLNRNNEIDGYEENSIPVMANVKVDGYDLNIESVYYDGIELTVFYNVTGKEKLDTHMDYWFESNIDFEKRSTYEYSLEYGEFINDNTFAGMVSIYIRPHDGSGLPEELNCKLNITKLCIGYGMGQEIEAEPIDLSLDSRNMEIKEYEINKEVDFEENTVEFIKAKEYPIGIAIESKNNVVDSNKDINYMLWDSKKGQLKGIAGLNAEDGVISFQYRLPSKDGDVYIIPWVNIDNEEFVVGGSYINKQLIKKGKSKYDLGAYGTFEILEINDEEDRTVMRVRATGWQTSAYFYLRGDEDDKYYHPIYAKDKKVLDVLDMEVTYVFNKLDKEKNYYLETSKSNLVILKDQIIKIEKK